MSEHNLEDLKSSFHQQHDERTNELSELSKRAYQLLRESHTDQAAELFHRILDIEPENNYALVGLGDALRKNQQYIEAIEQYQTCLRHHPGNNYALFGLADCHKSLGHFNKAIESWEEYLKHDSSNITVLTRVADAYRKIRDYGKSADLYERVLKLDDKNSYALIGLGHLNYDFKKYREALACWKTMEKRRSGNVDIRVLTSIGNCYRKLGEYESGIPYFEEAMEKQPENFYAIFGMADCYRGLHETKKSLVYWNMILDQDPDNKVILTRVGDAYRAMDAWETAAIYYKKALDIDFDIYAALGLALVDKAYGKTENAVSSLIALIDKDPRNHRLYYEAASCFEELGRIDEALDCLGRYMRQGLHNERIEDYFKRLEAS